MRNLFLGLDRLFEMLEFGALIWSAAIGALVWSARSRLLIVEIGSLCDKLDTHKYTPTSLERNVCQKLENSATRQVFQETRLYLDRYTWIATFFYFLHLFLYFCACFCAILFFMVNCRARHLSFWLAFRPLPECIRLGWVPQDCRTATQLGIYAQTPSEKWWNTHNEVEFFCVSLLLPGSFCGSIAPQSFWVGLLLCSFW